MRSIRLSLILCFLLLLVLSLGAVSGLVFRTTERGLANANESLRALVHARYEDRCRREKQNLDDDLLTKARGLARGVQVQVQFPNFRNPKPASTLTMLGVFSAVTSPFGHMQVPLWVMEGVPSPMFYFLHRVGFPRPSLVIKEVTPPHDGDNDPTHYYQINIIGDEWRSPNMEEATFGFNPNIFSDEKPALLDDTELVLDETVKVRRLRLKQTNVPVHRSWPSKRGRPPGETTPAKPTPPPQPGMKPPELPIFIQAAASTASLDATLAQFRAERDQQLADVEDNHQAELASLRNSLLLICLGTLAAAVLLGCWLVYLGLAPLRRLSDAVSKVSEKDFRLPLENRKLPVELQPIVHRLDQTLDQLKRVFEREKQAAADISHELRTPLAAMLITLDVGLRKPRSVEEYQEILEECRIAGQQMTQLVERMLALARLDAGADHLRLHEVDVCKLADQCVSLVRPLATARGVSLAIKNKGPASIKADPDKLREVLTNLLHNAIEYNRPHGSIVVKVERTNGHLQMEVSDTGIGIPEGARAMIFQRFYRQDPSRQAEGLHAGIGLALVKGYVDLMGGRIDVDSVEGEGSTFRIHLPVPELAATGDEKGIRGAGEKRKTKAHT